MLRKSLQPKGDGSSATDQVGGPERGARRKAELTCGNASAIPRGRPMWSSGKTRPSGAALPDEARRRERERQRHPDLARVEVGSVVRHVGRRVDVAVGADRRLDGAGEVAEAAANDDARAVALRRDVERLEPQ